MAKAYSMDLRERVVAAENPIHTVVDGQIG
jgi:hypothetical protein